MSIRYSRPWFLPSPPACTPVEICRTAAHTPSGLSSCTCLSAPSAGPLRSGLDCARSSGTPTVAAPARCFLAAVYSALLPISMCCRLGLSVSGSRSACTARCTSATTCDTRSDNVHTRLEGPGHLIDGLPSEIGSAIGPLRESFGSAGEPLAGTRRSLAGPWVLAAGR